MDDAFPTELSSERVQSAVEAVGSLVSGIVSSSKYNLYFEKEVSESSQVLFKLVVMKLLQSDAGFDIVESICNGVQSPMQEHLFKMKLSSTRQLTQKEINPVGAALQS